MRLRPYLRMKRGKENGGNTRLSGLINPAMGNPYGFFPRTDLKSKALAHRLE